MSVSDEYISAYGSTDREFMFKHGRPCVMVLKLHFRSEKWDFAVPFRSNIAPNVPKDQYFALPPRPTTKPRHRHGIHYIKMFPVERRFLQRFRTDGNPYYETVQRIVDENSKHIVTACQGYLDAYAAHGRPQYGVDIDRLIALLKQDRPNGAPAGYDRP